MPKKLRGVRVPHNKNTAGSVPIIMPPPRFVTIPLVMHIGAPSVCIVKPGDHVDVGQLIAEAGGYVGAPIHSSVSGTVREITSVMMTNGKPVPAVKIESDGLMTVSPSIKPPVVNDYDSFIAAVRASGAVGLGGAGFPTSVKLDIKDTSRIKEVIVNSAECEPYITSDTRTMIDRADDIAEGCRLLEKYLNVKKIYIGIEKNKPEAIASMRRLAANDPAVEVRVLPSFYPQGGEKVIIYSITGKIVPEGKLPIDVGTIVINCTTLAFIASYIKTGMPLVEKCITVDGPAVASPKNVIVPIGTAMSEVFEVCGGFKKTPAKFLQGGPMMGLAVYSPDTPVIKNNNAILAFDKDTALKPKETSCIRCGQCSAYCPYRLDPAEYGRALKANDVEKLIRLKVNLCMECGCCSYICPARLPLVQQNKMGKALVAEYQKKKKAEAGAAK